MTTTAPEPQWLRERRATAEDLYRDLPIPDASLEVWRHTELDLDLDRYEPAAVPGAPLATDVTADVEAAGRLVLVDGYVAARTLDLALESAGVVFADFADGIDNYADQLRGGLFSAVPPHVDKFTALHVARTRWGALVYVPRGVVIEAPLVVEHHVTAAASLALPHTLVIAETGAQVTVLDVYLSAEVDALVIPAVELYARDAANLRHLAIADLGVDVTCLGYEDGVVGRAASLYSGQIGLGGGLVRQQIDIELVGDGAEGRIYGLYFGSGDDHIDYRVELEHKAKHTTSDLFMKGAVDDRARAVFWGNVHIFPDAAGSAGYQTIRNLVLGADASAFPTPNLEIENNDVRCSHASAVGPPDEDERYYLATRGIAPEVADRLIVTGFFEDAIRRMPVAGPADWVRRRVGEKVVA